MAREKNDIEENENEDRIDVDLDDLTNIDSPYTLLEEGTVDFEIGDAGFQLSKTERPMWKVRLDTQDPDNPNETVFVNHYIMLDNKRGKFQTRQLLVAAGVPNKKIATDYRPSNAENWDYSPFIGTKVSVNISIKEDEEFGKQNQVRQFNVDL